MAVRRCSGKQRAKQRLPQSGLLDAPKDFGRRNYFAQRRAPFRPVAVAADKVEAPDKKSFAKELEDWLSAQVGQPPATAKTIAQNPELTYLRAKFGIRRAPKTLAKLRCISSDGPVFVRVGRNILYPQDGLDAYGQAIISAPMRSTCDRNPPAHADNPFAA